MESRSNGFIQKPGHIVADRARTRRRALRRFAGITDVVNGFVTCIRPHEQEVMGAVGATNPAKFGIIELDFFVPRKLIEIDGRENRPERKTIGLGNSKNIIGRDHRSG